LNDDQGERREKSKEGWEKKWGEQEFDDFYNDRSFGEKRGAGEDCLEQRKKSKTLSDRRKELLST